MEVTQVHKVGHVGSFRCFVNIGLPRLEKLIVVLNWQQKLAITAIIPAGIIKFREFYTSNQADKQALYALVRTQLRLQGGRQANAQLREEIMSGLMKAEQDLQEAFDRDVHSLNFR